MNKAVLKRFKKTKTGKVFSQKMGQGHSQAKKSGRQKLNQRRGLPLSGPSAKIFRKYLYN